VVVITIKEFPLKPVAIRGRCYRRVGASNRVMTPAEISELHMLSMGTSWDTTPHPRFHWEDLDLKLLAEYVRRARKTGRRGFQENEDLQSLARKVELLQDEQPTWASVIAFGKQPPLQAKVKCGKIRGTSTIVDDFVVDAPLLDQVEEVMNYMKRVLQLSYSFSGGAEREETWEYPMEALREVVTNAICHRDYSSPAQIQIKIFDDHLSVWNPGGLPFNFSLDDLFDPDHKSLPRNRQIAMLFYDCKLIEQYGSGIEKVLGDCRELGFPTPEFSTIQKGFQVVFRKLLSPGKPGLSKEDLRELGLNLRQLKAVQHVKEKGTITNAEYRQLGEVSNKTAYQELSELVQKEVFVMKGKGRGARYLLRGNDSGND